MSLLKDLLIEKENAKKDFELVEEYSFEEMINSQAVFVPGKGIVYVDINQAFI